MPGQRELAAWGEQLEAQAGQGHRFAPFALETVLAALMSGRDAPIPLDGLTLRDWT